MSPAENNVPATRLPAAPADIDQSSIDRIVAVIPLSHLPANLNRDELLSGLRDCLAAYYAALHRSSDASVKKRIRWVQEVGDAAKRFAKAAEQFQRRRRSDRFLDQEDSFSELEYLYDDVRSIMERANKRIGELKEELVYGPDNDLPESIRCDLPPRDYRLLCRSRSPFDWLAGIYLPDLFKKHLSDDIGFYRKHGTPEGAVIRFVEAALTEFKVWTKGRPYSRESIAQAVSDGRVDRKRKHAGKSKVGQPND